MAFVDLHRHDEFSTFDGFGKASELAMLAKELGHSALSITNHGNTNGLVQTHKACKKVGIKSILGVEGYFLPKHKEQERGFHLILIAKNLKGYGNLNRLQYEGEKQKYYNPIWDFDLLEEHSEGLICLSACVAGFLAQCIKKEEYQMAEKFLVKMKKIFRDDFYVEIQPYKIDEDGLQERVNYESARLAKKHGIKCVLTSDSHRGRKEDLPTYIKMHEIANHNIEHIIDTYGERYMPTEKEIYDRFLTMHTKSLAEHKEFAFEGSANFAKDCLRNISEIEEKCELNYLDELELKLPKLEGSENSYKDLVSKTKEGLKRRGKLSKDYIERCKEELEVIKAHGFADYFLIVADYVDYAKENDVAVGPGRGSVCNCLVAYALGITDVDSLLFNLDFRRFLRLDKKKIPDIDLDFQTTGRQQVIDYLCEKYEGHAARICSYGLYKLDNLMNDLFKVCCGEDYLVEGDKGRELVRIKSFAKQCITEEDEINLDMLLRSAEGKMINREYDNILVHFSKLYKKVRFIGTHSAGVAITGGKILDYVALRVDKTGALFTNYDLADIEDLNVVKFDILGLRTMESIADLRKATGVTVDYDEIIYDEKLMEEFRLGKCDGVFQFEKPTARNILSDISCDCFEDVVAASCMNRPGPLSLKMPAAYAHNKENIDDAKDTMYYEYTKETYGTIVYQEQLQIMCVEIGNLSWSQADRVMKLMKNAIASMGELQKIEADKKELTELFSKGAKANGFDKDEAKRVFENMLVYTFNKGHGVGYSLISIEEMFYKKYYPNEYWFVKLKYSRDDAEFFRFCEKAVADDSVVFIPHVNYSKKSTALRKMEGEKVIQLGINSIKGIGDKAAELIEEERKRGVFTSYDNFVDRCKSRAVTSKVVALLKETGSLEFNKKTYMSRVLKYNSALYSRASSR